MVHNVTFCEEHGRALYSAALVCGCAEGEEAMRFVAECLVQGLYDPVVHLWGDQVAAVCVCCAYLYPYQAMDAAVTAAMAVRRSHGLAPALN